MDPIFSDLTKSLGVFLITGLAIGFSTFLGLRYISAIGGFTNTFQLEATAIVVIVAISAFFLSPAISALTGLYIGYKEPESSRTFAFSTFAAFVGFFLLNTVSVGVLLFLLGENLVPATSSDPSTVLYSFLLLENSAAYLSFPSIIIAPIAAYLGSGVNE